MIFLISRSPLKLPNQKKSILTQLDIQPERQCLEKAELTLLPRNSNVGRFIHEKTPASLADFSLKLQIKTIKKRNGFDRLYLKFQDLY